MRLGKNARAKPSGASGPVGGFLAVLHYRWSGRWFSCSVVLPVSWWVGHEWFFIEVLLAVAGKLVLPFAAQSWQFLCSLWEEQTKRSKAYAAEAQGHAFITRYPVPGRRWGWDIRCAVL